MIDKIELQNMKALRNWATPLNTVNSNNFERLCAMALVFIGMWLDQEIVTKEKLRR